MLGSAVGEPAGRPRRVHGSMNLWGMDLVRKVRAPQGRVVGNADPG
jgi:hypothetical protein